MTTKQLDKEIERAYYRHATGKQINILDIPKLYKDVRNEVIKGKNLEDVVKEAIARYCA